jgi:hypothetical protein
MSQNIASVEIACNALKGEIVTTVTHTEPEYHHIGDPEDTRAGSSKVRIALRTFYTYGRTPGAATQALARFMAGETLASLPGVPVAVYGA